MAKKLTRYSQFAKPKKTPQYLWAKHFGVNLEEKGNQLEFRYGDRKKQVLVWNRSSGVVTLNGQSQEKAKSWQVLQKRLQDLLLKDLIQTQPTEEEARWADRRG
jgi:hypothetical protein